MIELDKVYNEDCLEGVKRIPDGSVDLCVTDPPYNIKIAEWDSWKTVDEYVEWCGKWIKEVERVLKNTGTFYFFHNDMTQISRIMEWMRVNTDFRFNSFIVWDKGDFRALSWKNPTEENNLRCWFNTCEYCLVYTFQDQTGLERVMLDVNNFQSLRKYAYRCLCYIGGGKPASTGYIERAIGNRKAEHFFYCLPKEYP